MDISTGNYTLYLKQHEIRIESILPGGEWPWLLLLKPRVVKSGKEPWKFWWGGDMGMVDPGTMPGIGSLSGIAIIPFDGDPSKFYNRLSNQR